MSVDELLQALSAKTAPPAPGILSWMVQGHGFSGSHSIVVESSGAIRRLRFDMQHRSTVEWESRASIEQLAHLANVIRESGFPRIAVPAGYRPRPDIGALVVTVAVVGGPSERASLPQDAASAPMSAIAEAFASLKRD